MAYGDFKHLPRRTVSDKVLSDKKFNISKNLKYDRDQSGLASMVYKPFDKKTSADAVKSKVILNQKWADKITQANY